MTRSAASYLVLTCGAFALWGGAAFAQSEGAEGVAIEPSLRVEAQGALSVEQLGDGELAAALAAADRQLVLLEGELAAIRAALESVSSTSAWLTRRIDQFSAQASALAMVDEGVLLSALSVRLADVESRHLAVQPALASGAQACAAWKTAALAAISQPGLLKDIQEQTQVQRDALRTTSQASDSLVRDVCRVNVEVEGVHTALAALRGEVAHKGESVPTRPTWLDAEPVVELTTSHGDLVLALRPDVAPRHVENFRRLVAAGFYDGLSFHRVVPEFVIQGGDPLGTGMGGPGWQIPAEFNDLPHLRGTLSMARMGQWDTAGSQFFLCLDDWSQQLDRKYTVFGEVLRGLATLDAIAALGSTSGVPSEIVTIHQAVLRERRPSDVPDER